MVKYFEKRYGVSYDDVRNACSSHLAMTDAAKSVNVPYKTFIRIAKKLGCFKSNIGGKGKTKKSAKKILLSEILSGNHPSYQTNKIRIRLIEEGYKEEKCELCNLTEWNNKKIPLELDHIDGNNSNHLLENLRILCPNCHAQTPTFSNRKR
jgi:hypothetical protein